MRILVFLLLMIAYIQAHADIYVSSSGNDSTNSCTTSFAPCATLAGAYEKTAAGGTILLNRGDTWIVTDTVYIKKTNLTIAAYGNGNPPVLSGKHYTEPSSTSPYAGLIEVGTETEPAAGNGFTAKDIEIRESGGNSIRVWSSNVTIDNVFSNGSYAQGFQGRLTAQNLTVENSTVFNHNWGALETNASSVGRVTLMCSAGDCNGGGWGVGLTTRAIGTVFKNNRVYAGWGESIGAGCGADSVLIEGNTVVDGKVGIYVDAATNITIRNNLVMGTATTTHLRGSTAGEGIGINNEPYCRRESLDANRAGSTANVSIYNNLVSGRKFGFFSYAETSSVFTGVKIYNNSFVDNQYAMTFTGGGHVNTIIANNIFYDSGDAKVVDMIKGFNIDEPKEGIRWYNNYWSYSPTVGASYAITNDPNPVIGGSINLSKENGYFAVDSYNLSTWITAANMQSQGGVTDSKGFNLSTLGITTPPDYYGNARPSASPNIGAFQSLSVVIPTPQIDPCRNGGPCNLIFLGDYEDSNIKTPADSGSGQPIINTFFYSGMGPNCEPRGNDPRPENGSRIATGPGIPVLSGKQSFRMEIRYDCDYRAFNEGDLQKPRTATSVLHPNAKLINGREYWVGMGFYLPSDYPHDYELNPDNLFQMIKEENGTTGSLGKNVISISLKNGRAEVDLQHPDGLENPAVDSVSWPATKGMWHQVVMNFRMCKISDAGCNGFIKIYTNNNAVPIYADTGPNTISSGHHVTPNIYKYAWHCTGDTRLDYDACMQNPNRTVSDKPRVIYFDNFNIGSDKSSLKEVMPSWGGTIPGTGKSPPRPALNFQVSDVDLP